MNEHLIVRAPKLIYLFGLGAIGFSLIILLILIFGESAKETIGYILAIFFILDGLFLLGFFHNYRLEITGEDCIYKSAWGSKREFTLSDIDYVEKSNQGLRIFSKSGATLCKVSYIAVDIMELDDFLKRKKISFRMRGSCSCWR